MLAEGWVEGLKPSWLAVRYMVSKLARHSGLSSGASKVELVRITSLTIPSKRLKGILLILFFPPVFMLGISLNEEG